MSNLPRGTITFLFTDLQDSTRLWESYPDAMQHALRRHDEIIESLSRLHHGQIVRPRGEGDSRFVVFRRALDGIKAAAAIQQALHAEDWPGGTSLRVRIGVHTGEGHYREGDYYGPAVNRAAQLRALAHGGQTLLSRTTYELVQDALPEGNELIHLGQVPLKGLERPESLYQLTAPGLPTAFPPIVEQEKSTQPQAILPDFLKNDQYQDPGQSPIFVGRESELARLDSVLDQTTQGAGQVLLIEGEAGQGKTALMDEFTRRGQRKYNELIITRGKCNAHSGVGDPYLPFREGMSMLTGNVESPLKSGRITREHARRLWNFIPQSVDAVLKKGPSLLNIFIHGDAFLDRVKTALPDDATRQRELQALVERKNLSGPGIDQTMLFEQFAQFLLTVSEHAPLVLLLDDMQWSDRASIDLFFHLARRIEGHPILLAAAYRPDEVALSKEGERHPLAQVVNELKRTYGEVIIDLGSSATNEGIDFVNAFLDTQPNKLGDDFRKSLYDHTGGQPLFTVELLRAMQDRGELVQNEEGKWIEGHSLDWDRLPARVEAVIEERIARLEKEIRELLSVASVEGEDFTVQVIARVQDIEERKLLRDLSQELSKRHRLVREAGEVETGQRILSKFQFAHHLFQRYLYNGLSAAERRLLHGEITNVLEDIFGEEVERVAVQLAYHSRRANLDDKASRYLRLAGDQARTRYANQEAIRYYTALLDHLPQKNKERYEILSKRARVYDLIAERKAQLKDAREMMAIAKKISDPSLQIDALLLMADAHGKTEHILAEKPTHKALTLAREIQDPLREARALSRLAMNAWLKYEYTDSRDYSKKAASLFKETDNPREAANCLHILSLTHLSMYEQQEALRAAREAIHLSQEITDPQLEAISLRRLAIIYMDIGQPEKALPIAEKALKLHRKVGDIFEEAHAHNVLGLIHGWMGQMEEQESKLRKSLQIGHEVRATTPILFASINLSQAHYRRQGYYEEAIHFIDGEIRRAMGMEDDWLIGNLQYNKADFLWEIGQFEASIEAFHQAADILQQHAPQGYYHVNSTAYIGLQHAHLGEKALAKTFADRSLKMNESIQNQVKQSAAMITWGQTALTLGDQNRIEHAHRMIEERMELILNSTHWDIIQMALNTSAIILLMRSEVDSALDRSTQLMHIQDQYPTITAPHDYAYTHSKALRAVGREREADQYLEQAYQRVNLVADHFQTAEWRRSWLQDARHNQKIRSEARAREIAQ